MTPRSHYLQDLSRKDFAEDAAQAHVVNKLESLYQQLISPPKNHWWQTQKPIQGLYIWGRVGRGKTYLMDTFYHCLPEGVGLRLHFHRFMQRVHSELKELSGHKNPLQQVAKGLATEARVLCFDEFFVSDIGDAMILGNLLQTLFELGVADVAGDLLVSGRSIKVRRQNHKVVWFDFMSLCDGPRSQLDYIDISQRFDVVIVSDIPVLGGAIVTRKIAIGTEDSSDNTIGHVDRSVKQGRLDDPARRFIALVDEFYDWRIRLIVSAAAPIRKLYRGGRVSFEFQRTESRLIEMQSEEYLGGLNDAIPLPAIM